MNFSIFSPNPGRTTGLRDRISGKQAVFIFSLSLLWMAALTGQAQETSPESITSTDSQFTYVIVHGAWGGGWAFKEVDHLLSADGHTVYRPTLTGQGKRVHLADSARLGANIDLSLHIQDIVNVILWEDLHDVVLVGHSYGGMVITGVVDRVPERIQHVVYLDAFLPEDGESLNTAGGRDRGQRQESNGFIVPEWLDEDQPLPHDVPHPAKTLNEPISLTNQEAARKLPTTYILTADNPEEPDQDGFYSFYERAGDRGWSVHIMEGDHNVQWSRPKELVELLEQAPLSAKQN
jgi:pimeloyl-ACP methyl ester carboxylesterase